MLRRFSFILLSLVFTINIVIGNEDFKPPYYISKDSSDIKHIFKKDPGHLEQDTPENRSFIESAASTNQNQVGTNAFGKKIYFKTMSDGTQAWAEVWKDAITDGGKNNYPKIWVPDSSNYKGGDYVTPKFSKYDPKLTTFKGHLVVNRIASDYEAHNKIPEFSFPLVERKILGVTGRYGKILNLLDYPEQTGEHIFLLPTSDLTEEEVVQILREVAKGVYVYEAHPFFSLHFNRYLTSYPVIHPVYRNTLTGEAIAMLDYYMKGFTTGRSFDQSFIYQWDENRNRDVEFLFNQSFEFKDYCNSLGLEYTTFKEILEELMGQDSYHGVFTDCFDISYRIVAKQNAISKNGDTLSFQPDFDIVGIVDGEPLNESEERHYGYLKQACSLMCDQIKEILPKLPICQKHFQVLYLANFFSYYCNTLKEVGKIPMLERKLPEDSLYKGCPKTFPPIPVDLEDEVKISFMKLFDVLTSKELSQAVVYFKTSKVTDGIISDAVDVTYDGIYKYFTNAGIVTKLSPDQCQDITIEVLQYCRKRYANVRKNIVDVLKSMKVSGSPDSRTTQQKFLKKVNELIHTLRGQEKEEMLKFKDQFNLWFTNPLALCFGQSGVSFNLVDGSLKIILNCDDKKTQLAGGCGVVVEDIDVSSSWFLGYFHGGTKVSVRYGDLESENADDAREEAKALLYPPKNKYPFSNPVFHILNAIDTEDVALFDRVKNQVEDWEFKDPYGVSLLHHAAAAQNPYFLRYIMSKHVNLFVRDEQEFTALHRAAQEGSLECIKLLVKENPELLEAKAQDDETPLFIAIQSKTEDSIDLLLKLGANPNCIIINDLSALLWAIQSKSEEAALKLLNHKSIDIDYSLKDNSSAIELAINMELPQVLRKLIDLGADVNRKAGGYTPIHNAVCFGYLEGVRILLECPDTQINLLTTSGESALDLARKHGFGEIECILLPYFR